MNKLLLGLAIAVMLCDRATAVDLWWDTNGTTDGSSGGTSANGAFTGANLWNSDPTGGAAGALSTWDSGASNIAHFSAGTNATGTSTITANATLGGLVIEDGTVVMNGTYTLGSSPITVNSGAILQTNSSARISTTAGSVYTLNGGTLRTTNTGSAGAFVDADSTIVLNGGGTIDFTVAGVLNIIASTNPISGTGPLTKNGIGALALAGAGTYTGATIINDGELRIRTSNNRLPTATDVTVNSPGILNLNGLNQQIASLSGNGRVGLGAGTLTVNGATGTTFSGIIENLASVSTPGAPATGSGAGNLTKTGASTLTLTTANTYTGLTTINTSGGAISIGDGGTTGSIVSSVDVNNANATLIFNRSDDFSYGTTGTAGGIVTGVGLVRKEGAGVLTMSNATNEWTNTGGIIINGGTIRFGTAAAGFGATTPVTVNTLGTFDMNSVNDTFGSLAGAGTVLMTGNATLGATIGTTTFSGIINNTTGTTFRKGADSQSTQLSTQILSGTNTLGPVRVNSGTLDITGNTSVSQGTATINVAGGKLLINGTTSTVGATTVNSTGLLGGTGSLTGGVTVNTGGRLGAGVDGGNSTTFTVDTLTLEAGSLLRPTLGAPGSPLGSSDVANVSGSNAFTLNGSQLEIATVNGVGSGTYRVLKYTDSYNGLFSNLLTSTQAGFDSVTPIDNTTDKAIDVAIVITDRSWVADTATGNWSNGSNWGVNPTQPNGPGAIANFVATSPNNPAHTVTLDDDNKTVGVVNFNSATSYTIDGLGSDRLIIDTWGADGVINVANNSHSIVAPVELKKNTNITVTNASDTFAISGIVSGTGGIIKSGAGTLHLSGTAANTYSGGNTVSAGILLGDTNTIQGTIANSGAVIFEQTAAGTFSSVISGTGSVTKNGSGRLVLSGANTFTGGFNFNTGTVAAGNNAALGATTNVVNIADGITLATDATAARSLTNAFTINGNFTLGETSGGTGVLTMAGTMNLGAATRTITVVNATDTISGLISGDAGVGLIKEGSGQLILAAATNTYTGPTTVNAGTLAVDADGTIGDGTGLVTLAAAGVKLNATANRTSVTLNPVANPIDMTADAEITTSTNANTVNLNFTGLITASAGVGTLTFRNDGANAATDVFDPRFSAGGINFGRPIVLAAGTLGSTVRLSSFNTTATTQTFTGEISGTGSFRRSATAATTGGVTEFTAANTYSGGTFVNDGTLLVNNTTGSGTGTGAVTVGVGAPTNGFTGRLGGTGSIDGLITVQEGGTIAPGNSIGTLTAAGGLTLAANSILEFELGAPGSPYGASDLINVPNTGVLTINGGTVNLINAGSLGAGTYKLIDYEGALGGLFSNLAPDPTPPPGFTYQLIDNFLDTSIDLQVTASMLLGDYNLDGNVNAADYVLWRKDPTNPAYGYVSDPQDGYNTWRANFGNPPGSGSSLGDGGAVPEPAAFALLLMGVLAMCSRRRR